MIFLLFLFLRIRWLLGYTIRTKRLNDKGGQMRDLDTPSQDNRPRIQGKCNEEFFKHNNERNKADQKPLQISDWQSLRWEHIMHSS